MIPAHRAHNALFRLCSLAVVLLLVFTTIGCSSPEPTAEPTTAEDTVYEKLEAAVLAVNSRDTIHTRSYITPVSPAEADPTGQTDFIEGWVSGSDLYEEQTYLGKLAPRYLRCDGNSYIHRSDGLWMSVLEDANDPYGYQITLPSKNLTMTWTETGEFLDISFTDEAAPGTGVMIRLNSAGQLVWYSTWTPATIQGGGSPQSSTIYATTYYLDTDPAQILAHLDSLVPGLIENMEIYESK